MNTTATQVTRRQAEEQRGWDGETLGWIGMVVVAVVMLLGSAWQVRQQNLELAAQAAVVRAAE